MDKKSIIALSISLPIVIIICVIVFIVFRESTITMYSEPVTKDDITYEVIESTHAGSTHSFHIDITNNTDKPFKVSGLFRITNKDKRYEADNVEYSDTTINPNMTAHVDVEFKMNENDLTSGDPVLIINRSGLLTDYIIELPLYK